MNANKISISVTINLFVFLLISWNSPVSAARYVLQEDSNVIGQLQTINADPAKTLVQMAREYDLGFDEMRSANPGVDMWVPRAGQKITLPTRFILPDQKRRGIVINLAEKRLFYYASEYGEKIVYTFPLGIGRQGWSTPTGETSIINKKVNPSWVVPKSILDEYAAANTPLPKVVPPGPDNPLGNYALRLGIPGYLLHGTNKPSGVGMRVSHGCIRMFPEDISLLFEIVPVGTKVNILDQPYKIGLHENKMLFEVHLPEQVEQPKGGLNLDIDLSSIAKNIVELTDVPLTKKMWNRALQLINQRHGIPSEIGVIPDNLEGRPGYFLQLGEFPSVKGAKQMATFFIGLNVATVLGSAPNKGYCRVLSGPFPLKSKAEGELRRIKASTGIEGNLLPKMAKSQIPQCSPKL